MNKKIIAHRGLSSRYPENTLLAFRKALDTQAFALECDVHLSHEDVPIVIHDEDLSRTTTGKGLIGSYSLDQLMTFSAGAGEKIPSLKEVLDLVIHHSKKELFIEIKTHEGDLGYRNRVGAIVYETVMGAISKKKNRVRFISFDEFILKKIRELDRTVKLAPIFFKLPKEGSLADHALALQATAVIFSKKLLTKKNIFHTPTQVEHFVYTAIPREFPKLFKMRSLTGFATNHADLI